ncbi:hypothetical protein [Streptomyces sp. HNM0574]|uniref:hypothetical protein n=1 Tax=Streptomyces sp. HNM0574 TaxID=2714954 RepID=UPI001469F9B9|nr:hypothetical protein [Streptomyces sp. HNM0574]NLU69560.1 hypothetical protein [Streptomyces sp. HNM0574]
MPAVPPPHRDLNRPQHPDRHPRGTLRLRRRPDTPPPAAHCPCADRAFYLPLRSPGRTP